MRFRFRLERALHFARLRETMQKSRIAAATARLKEGEARLESMRDSLRGMLSPSGGRLELARSLWLEAKVGLDSAAIKQLETTLSSERSGIEKLKASLAHLMRRTKALESLKEKRRADFRVEEGRRTQARLDESFRLLKTAQSMNENPESEDA